MLAVCRRWGPGQEGARCSRGPPLFLSGPTFRSPWVLYPARIVLHHSRFKKVKVKVKERLDTGYNLDTPNFLSYHCVTRAPLLYFIRSWVALSFKVVCQSVSLSGIGNTCPDLNFLQYIKAWMSSTDPVSSITNCYRLIVSYTDPVHSFIIS